MKIGVVGIGNVGKTLGGRWAQAGHQVMYGVRNVNDPDAAELKQQGGANTQVGSVREAIGYGDVVVFAIPYGALEATIKAAGDFGDRVILDCTNPISADFSGPAAAGGSAAEEIAHWSGSQRVVKIFNTVGFNIMANPIFDGTPTTMLYCGDDAGAKQIAGQLAADLGFDPVDAGPLQQARWLEGFAWLWISMAMKYGHGREMAFALHRR